jgi:hypothetical protein
LRKRQRSKSLVGLGFIALLLAVCITLSYLYRVGVAAVGYANLALFPSIPQVVSIIKNLNSVPVPPGIMEDRYSYFDSLFLVPRKNELTRYAAFYHWTQGISSENLIL